MATKDNIWSNLPVNMTVIAVATSKIMNRDIVYIFYVLSSNILWFDEVVSALLIDDLLLI